MREDLSRNLMKNKYNFYKNFSAHFSGMIVQGGVFFLKKNDILLEEAE